MRAEGIHKTFHVLLIPELRNRWKSKPSGTGRKSFLQSLVDIWLQLRDAFLIQDEYPVKICSPVGSELGRACVSRGGYKQRCVLLGEAFSNLHVVSVQIGLALAPRTAVTSCSGFGRNQERRKERGTLNRGESPPLMAAFCRDLGCGRLWLSSRPCSRSCWGGPVPLLAVVVPRLQAPWRG